jgi:hypothetical protein
MVARPEYLNYNFKYTLSAKLGKELTQIFITENISIEEDLSRPAIGPLAYCYASKFEFECNR